jgi:hypothetical protein
LILPTLSAQVCFLLPHSYFFHLGCTQPGEMAYVENQKVNIQMTDLDLMKKG